MKRFMAQVNVGGVWVKTIVYADTAQHASYLLKAQFGAPNAPHMPVQVQI